MKHADGLADESGKIILTRKGEKILVDAEDYDIINSVLWRISDTGYAVRTIQVDKKRNIKMHKLILPCESQFEIDHINNNRLDNRKCNLRVVTRTQNSMNSSKKSHGSSKYKGVGFMKSKGKWRARIKINGIETHLGLFKDEKEAALAYNKAALINFGEFAKLNKI